MAKVAVSYGPPGQRGVSMIMGLGADDFVPSPTDALLAKAGWIGVGVWALGALLKKRRLRDAALGASTAAFAVRYLAQKNLSK